MIANLKIKYEFKTMLGVIRNIVLDFILYFAIAYAQLQHKIHYTSLEEVLKKNLWQTIYSSNCTQKFSIHYKKKKIELKYNVNITCNFLFGLKVWNTILRSAVY